MLKKEMDDRLGRITTQSEYDELNEMYIASPDMDKDSFCEAVKGDRYDLIAKSLMLAYKSCECSREHLKSQVEEIMQDIAEDLEMQDRGKSIALDLFRKMAPHEKVIVVKLEHGLGLSKEDIDLIKEKIL